MRGSCWRTAPPNTATDLCGDHGEVAHELGIDHSGASWMVSEASRLGHLFPEAAADDARRATLTMTEDGLDIFAAVHAYQDDVFAQLTAGWSAQDATCFATNLRRLADQ